LTESKFQVLAERPECKGRRCFPAYSFPLSDFFRNSNASTVFDFALNPFESFVKRMMKEFISCTSQLKPDLGKIQPERAMNIL